MFFEKPKRMSFSLLIETIVSRNCCDVNSQASRFLEVFERKTNNEAKVLILSLEIFPPIRSLQDNVLCISKKVKIH